MEFSPPKFRFDSRHGRLNKFPFFCSDNSEAIFRAPVFGAHMR